MSKRLNYYFRQKVGEGELDDGFAYLEDADQAIITDVGFTGVLNGMAVSQRAAGANLTVDVSAGIAYDKSGERVQFSSTQNVDLSVDENGVSTAVASAGNTKVISVFAKFTRSLSDPRTDGNSVTVYFQEDESFAFIVRQSGESASPSPPALDTNMVLLADVTRAYGATTIVTANIASTARREDSIVVSGTPYTLRRGRVKDALADLLTGLNATSVASSTGLTTQATNLSNHINASTAHTAAQVAYGGGAFVGTQSVESALDSLQAQLVATPGAALLGAATTAATYLFGLATATIQGQINELRAYLDLGQAGRRVRTISAATTITKATDREFIVDTSGGAVAITLPAPALGLSYNIKDAKGTFGTNACTLVRAGAEKIEGLASSLILSADWGAYEIFTDGTDWFMR
jgi:hypothetical protein